MTIIIEKVICKAGEEWAEKKKIGCLSLKFNKSFVTEIKSYKANNFELNLDPDYLRATIEYFDLTCKRNKTKDIKLIEEGSKEDYIESKYVKKITIDGQVVFNIHDYESIKNEF